MTRLQLKCWLQITGTAQQVFEWGGGGGGGAGLWISIQFLLSDGECYYNDKTMDLFPHLQ